VFADPTSRVRCSCGPGLAALGRLLGPLTLGKVYDVSHPAAFFVAAAVMTLGDWCACGYRRVHRSEWLENRPSTARRADAQR